MGDNTTLAELLGLNLHECEEEVKNIVDKAVKEMSMEKILRDLDTTWSKMEFEHEVHPRTRCSLLKGISEMLSCVRNVSFVRQVLYIASQPKSKTKTKKVYKEVF